MNVPAKPQPSPAPLSPGDGGAAGSLAEAVAAHALKQAPEAAAVDPEKKWADMGGELYAALEAKDKAGFGKLFAKQVKIAVAEALRGNKR